jgi:hypothetical protein
MRRDVTGGRYVLGDKDGNLGGLYMLGDKDRHLPTPPLRSALKGGPYRCGVT